MNTQYFRCVAPAALAFVALATTAGCGQTQRKHNAPFWQRALGDPVVRVVPGRDTGGPGITVTDEYNGTVIGHERATGSAADHVLTIRRAGGDEVRVYYRIGAEKSLPVARDDRVRLLTARRKHAEDVGVDIGLMVWRLAPAGSSSLATATAAADSETLVAVVQMGAVLERKRIPALLRTIRATDSTAYHESGTYIGECEEIRAHLHFRVRRPKWVDQSRTPLRARRLLPPGVTVHLDDGSERFEVLLLDNRKTESSTCVMTPEPTWAWSALRRARPRAEVASQLPRKDKGRPPAPSGRAVTTQPAH